MNIDNNFYNHDYSRRSYTLREAIEGKVNLDPLPQIPDAFIKAKTEAYNRMQEDNKAIFLKLISEKNKKHLEKFLKLPNYNDSLYEFFIHKKPAELEYLYKLACLKDAKGQTRIPGDCFPYFSEIPHERLKIFEPIITSKNYRGDWNYSSYYILSLNYFSDKQLHLMSKLAKQKVNGYTMQVIGTLPSSVIDMEKFAQKAEILNKIYGNKLREVSLLINDNMDLFITAKVSLERHENIPDEKNFKEIYIQLDYEFDTFKEDKKTNIDTTIKNLHNKIEKKLYLFNENDLNNAINNIKADFPDAEEEEILVVMQKLTQFANYSSLKPIAKELDLLNAKKTISVGEINSCFDYFFNSKKIAQPTVNIKSNYAYFITKNDVNDRLEMSYIKQWLKAGWLKNIRFINLEGWTDGVNLLTDDKKLEEKTKNILKKAKKLAQKEKHLTFRQAVSKVLNNQIESTMQDLGASVTTIKIDAPASRAVILEQMKPNYPSLDILKSTIQTIPEHYINNKNLAKTVTEKLAKYYDENLNVYSKQSIIESMRIINAKIKEYLEQNNIPEDNIYLIFPKRKNSTKSFEIITKMYSDLYNIPKERILPVINTAQLNQMPPNSTFVILDDIAGSGKSMTNVAEYVYYGKTLDKDKHVIFAPICGTDKGITYINTIIAKQGRNDCDSVIYIDSNIKKSSSIKKVFNKLYYKLDNSVYGCDGFNNNGQCIAFPYMTPDNNTTLASDITKYFVPDYNCIKNPDAELFNIERKTYYNNIFNPNIENKN